MSAHRPFSLPREITSTQHRLLLLFGLLTGFGLRLVRLGADSLWYDETVSVFLAGKDVASLNAHTAGDIHPPGYYLLLHLWQILAEPTLNHGLEFLFAWPSLLFGMLILPLLYSLGRRLFNRQVGLMALWLAAVHPFHIWYSQEVRMYTLGAFLGLLCLWAMLAGLDHLQRRERAWPWLALFAFSAAAGLYALYYFLFLLISLNLLALALLWQRSPGRSFLSKASPIWPWIAAQSAALLLWTPWLPIFLRQALDPPVPPWRVPWQTAAQFTHTLTEVLSAQVIGQSPPGMLLWPYAVLTLLLTFAGFGYAKQAQQTRSAILVIGHALLPVALIFLLTLLATPLYHVRYAFTYAPPLLLLFAAGLAWLFDRRPALGSVALAGLLALGAAGSVEMWSQPAYRADDHRGAVTTLAQNWRPGDGILINAGWGYTILETYWPTELAGPDAALPPPLGPMVRLGDPLPARAQADAPLSVSVVRGGSVDGPPSLGWGAPDSDFFAISQAESERALAALSGPFDRLWHYRIYDTVSDPTGSMRAQLADMGAILLDLPVAGRDFARLQLFSLKNGGSPVHEELLAGQFGEAIGVSGVSLPATIPAGETVYVSGRWHALADLPHLAGDLAVSLRVVDGGGRVVAQQDGGFLPPTAAYQPGQAWTETFALPVPVSLPPATYQIVLLLYGQVDGQPLPLSAGSPLLAGNSLALGPIAVTLPQRPVKITESQARFDYIDLVRAQLVPTADGVAVDLVWMPRPQAYQDTYLATLSVLDAQGTAIAESTEPLGGWAYPSGEWAARVPVAERRILQANRPMAPGNYTVTLAVSRAADGQAIPARRAWWQVWPGPSEVELGDLNIDDRDK